MSLGRPTDATTPSKTESCNGVAGATGAVLAGSDGSIPPIFTVLIEEFGVGSAAESTTLGNSIGESCESSAGAGVLILTRPELSLYPSDSPTSEGGKDSDASRDAVDADDPSADDFFESDFFESDFFESDFFESDFFESDFFESDFFESDAERPLDGEAESREEVDADDRSDDEFREPESPSSANATPGAEANAIPMPNATESALN